MFPKEKEILNLIKKVQKEVAHKKKMNPKKKVEDIERFEADSSTEIFDEMKKLPFKE
jgi:hypothetical protein